MSTVIDLMRKTPGRDALPPRLRRLLNRSIQVIALPVAGMAIFLLLWAVAAQNIDTSLGRFPGPAAVLQQAELLLEEHRAEAVREAEFHVRQEQRNAERLAREPGYEARIRPYTGKPTFPDQIRTSLVTVLSGFTLAMLVALPLGVAIGLNRSLHSAINPLIQLFKPVSPLAWLPLITLVVSALYDTPDPALPKSFLNSLLTVALCCLWPMVVNTALGVAGLDPDLRNVSRVLRLPPLVHVRRVVLPYAVPAIFTGMRLSLGVAWMVLIAAEMLAQNPGLGKFVWDEFQNGSSESLGRIMVAVLVIGGIGFLLDRLMLALQQHLSWDKSAAAR